MKIIVSISPVTPANLYVINTNDDIDFFIDSRTNLFYSDFIPNIKQLYELYPEIDEINIMGPTDFASHVAEELKNVFKNNTLKISITK